ncbi:MAG: FAD-binding oxidoreductase [Myxococcales bacterium]|nr:FAD-binding oxidoreductase [Myxococcales bacterium]HRC56984.1 FAD-binding oxidoreductase [Kofleriaceae bacterium]
MAAHHITADARSPRRLRVAPPGGVSYRRHLVFAPVDPDKLRLALEAIFGSRRVSLRLLDRQTYARDMWPRLLLARRQGEAPAHVPNAVVWPEHVREVAAVVKLARELRVPVIPYGGGSGVCGGVIPLFGGITIDLKRMRELRSVSGEDLICDVDAGMNGERFERELAHRGYTFGHFPSSIYCSTVGGWLATRAAGQLSTKYGKVEDRAAGLTVVTGKGEIIETDGPNRALRGPNWTQLLVGSEGTLGIITSARLRVAPAPQLRVYRGFELPDVATGIIALRRVLQRGLRPAVLRLYDELDTFLASMGHKSDKESDEDTARYAGASAATGDFASAPLPPVDGGALPSWPVPEPSERGGWMSRLVTLARDEGARKRLMKSASRAAQNAALSRGSMANRLFGAAATTAHRGCRLIVGLEGSRIRTEVEAQLTFAELEAAGAKDRGEEPGLAWLAHRYAVSYRMSPIFRDGAFVDTMEVASSWDRLLDLYHAVRGALAPHAVVMAHLSHAYADGCSIYFTFAASVEGARNAERVYDAIWKDGMEAATRVGGTISHHHGVGLLKAPYMAAEHREAMAIFRGAKAALDPDGILNPGKMGLVASRKEAP